MKRVRFPVIDTARVRTCALGERRSKVALADLASPVSAGLSMGEFLAKLPGVLAGHDLREVARRVASAHRNGRPVVLGMGAHPIKVGLSPLIVDLVERGIVSAVAMNGAGIIHDFELAYCGATSEDVADALRDGSFGMAGETAEFLNRAIADGVRDGGLGIGSAVGKRMIEANLPHAGLSIVAACARLEVPASVHVAVGTDTLHMHPQADGQAIGEGSLRDFRLLVSVVTQIEGGVFINLGSAVIIPEVFLKALALARNLGYGVKRFTTVNMDFISHYRPSVNVVDRPTRTGGRGFHLIGHHEIMLPLLCAAVHEELAADA